MNRTSPARPLLFLLLSCATAAAYYPAWRGGLVWDDDAHLTQPALQSLGGLWRIWTDLAATQQYYPLTHSVFWLQHALWGDSVVGYHAVNILLHATSALLIVLLLRKLAIPGAVLAAFIFALHPVHVESVAWISELKNTLSAVFYLAAALAYLKFDDTRHRRFYIVASLFFVMALLSKTVTATLPVALLIVLWWRRGSLQFKRDVQPLLPFFVLGIAAGLLTAYVERHFIGAQGAEFELTALERVLVAGRATWFYFTKLLVPYPLLFVYPRWQLDAGALWQLALPLALAALLVAFWLLRQRTRTPLAVALLFCAGLFPALGFVDVFPFRYSFVADHFQYMASIPVIAAGAALLHRVRPWSYAVPALLMALTLNKSAEFESAETLYSETLRGNPEAWLAHNNLGRIYAESGRYHQAGHHFDEALRLNPAIAEHHLNVGLMLLAQDSLKAAEERIAQAIGLDPRNPNAHSNLGVVLLRQQRVPEAMAHFLEALQLAPGHPQATQNMAGAHHELGVKAARSGVFNEAIAQFEAAVRYQPADALLRYSLGTAYLAAGRNRDAEIELAEALRLRPDFPEAQANLAAARGR